LTNSNRIVSSENEELILVDVCDRETGYLSKAECHDGDGILHRAFSVFLFNERGDLLLQERSPSKRLWPGYWSNSCCSHPRRGESMAVATQRRLHDELNIETSLEFVYRFNYQASYAHLGSERELCHVYLGKTIDQVRPNELEISAIRFVAATSLANEIAAVPDRFTPWLKMEWQTLCNDHRDRLERYCSID
jgi:isopentenyl-diphosphate delta-isomerase